MPRSSANSKGSSTSVTDFTAFSDSGNILSLSSNDSSLGKVKIDTGLIGTSAEQNIVSGNSIQIQAIAKSGAQFQKPLKLPTRSSASSNVSSSMTS